MLVLLSASVGLDFDVFDPAKYFDAAKWLARSFAGFNSIADQAAATIILVLGVIASSAFSLGATLVLAPFIALYGFGIATLRLLWWAATGRGRVR